MTKFSVALAAAMLLSAAAPGNAQACSLALEDVSSLNWEGRGGGYDPFDAVSFSDRFTFKVVHLEPAGTTCDVVVRIEPIGPSRLSGPAGSALDYALRTEQNQPTTAESLDFRRGLDPGEPSDVSFVVFIPALQTSGSGQHEARLRITAFEDVAGVLQQRDTKDAILRATVISAARMAFVGAVGRRQTVDFGELTDGKSAPPVFLDVRSTGDFEIRLTSEQRGSLTQTVAGTRWVVPYSATLGGGAVDLTALSGDTRRFGGPTAATGDRIPLDLRIGTVGNVRAGTYRDVVTIEVTPSGR